MEGMKMSLFTIDNEKCDKDGICALECPAHIIKMTKQGPALIQGAKQFCIRCGHCVAVCPKAAFSLEFLSPDQCMPIEKQLVLTADHAEHFLRSRRSVRRYKNKPVPEDILEKVLTIACCAPTASNNQPVKWLVVNGEKAVGKIGAHVIDWMRYALKTHPQMAKLYNLETLITKWDKGEDRVCRNAPLIVFAYASDAFPSAATDCHLALAYLELALPGFNLGSCWAGYVNSAFGQWPNLAAHLKLPEKHTCHGALMVGFPKLKYYRAPKRNTPDIRYHAG